LGVLRVVFRNDEPWFVNADLADGLGSKDPKNGLRCLDEDEKAFHVFDTAGGPQQLAIVSEAGAYFIILRSHAACKPGTAAHRFRKWACGVLAEIRKTGRCVVDPMRPLTNEEFTDMVVKYNALLDSARLWRVRAARFPVPAAVENYNRLNDALMVCKGCFDVIKPDGWELPISAGG
jgi:prophage antirepressor-like protein